MALSGIEIFKLLPKTNCRECGLSTCLAFAMSLSAGKIELSACPDVSEEAKAKLTASETPPVKNITIGTGEKRFNIGGESVMFRHEKGFNHPTGLATLISDQMDGAEVVTRLQRFCKLRYHYLGRSLYPELVAIKSETQDSKKFTNLIENVIRNSDANLILMSDDPGMISAGLQHCADKKPLIYAATPSNVEQMADLALQYDCPIVARTKGLTALVELSNHLTNAGVQMIVLDSGARSVKQALAHQVHIRRAAVNENIHSLGFPTIALPCEMAADLAVETLIAAMFISKYTGIIVLSDIQSEALFPLLLQRMAIFSDPEKPLKAPKGVYSIGAPHRYAPVILASSWALNYYHLILAAEECRVPIYLCMEHQEEPDVMCWCHHCLQSSQKGKFNPENTARFINGCKLEERIDHQKLLISERNAQFKADLEQLLPHWEIVVAPVNMSILKGFLKDFAKGLARQCKST
jgi:acetyl-CoA decarbonylase/synthase complex subunit gamma